MPARTARAGGHRHPAATADGADREDRQLLLQLVAMAGRTLEGGAFAHEQLEAVLALLAAIFEERHWTEDTAGPARDLGGLAGSPAAEPAHGARFAWAVWMWSCGEPPVRRR
jgi:hypothetical protein